MKDTYRYLQVICLMLCVTAERLPNRHAAADSRTIGLSDY